MEDADVTKTPNLIERAKQQIDVILHTNEALGYRTCWTRFRIRRRKAAGVAAQGTGEDTVILGQGGGHGDSGYGGNGGGKYGGSGNGSSSWGFTPATTSWHEKAAGQWLWK